MSKTNTKTTAQVESTEQSKFDKFNAIGMTQLMADHKNISGVIRYLDSENLTRGEIAKVTGKRYQHVRNVLVTPVAATKAS